jgi:HK97 family phage major capsid protein
MKTKQELLDRIAEIEARVREIDTQYAGQWMDPSSPDGVEWNAINAERAEHRKTVAQLKARERVLIDMEADDAHAEEGVHFNTGVPGAVRGQDIYDLSTVRMTAATPDAARSEMHERAHRAIDSAHFPHESADEAACKQHLTRMLAIGDNRQGELARRILATGSETYKRAFGKKLQGIELQAAEYRAISEGGSGGADGGFAVPYTLDPTIIPTSNQSVNPYRPICRTIQLIGAHTWKGVSSAGVVATYRNEGDESADNSPKFAQPSVDVQRADVFIPFSVELEQDWSALGSEIARQITDAKDNLEATAFTTGSGTAPNPQGIITGATITVLTAATATFASPDLDQVEEALGPRFQARAQWVGNRAIYNLVRHFATNNGPDLWVRVAEGLTHGGNTGRTLLGYAANESAAMDSTTASAKNLLILGDFSYFAIVDRVGMNIEVIPHLMGVDGRPIGMRGFYAVWRNATKVLSANAFRVLVAR